MTVHDEIESLTDVYLAGGLDESERREMEAHANSCAACASVFRDAKDFHGWVKGTSATGAPPPDLENRIIANFRARTFRRAPKLVRFLAGVAALFILVVVGSVFSRSDEGVTLAKAVAPAGGMVHKNAEVTDYHYAWSAVDQSRGPSESAETFVQGIGGGGGGGERARNALKKADFERAEAAEKGGMADELTDHNESEKDARAADKSLERKNANTPLPYLDERKIIRNGDLHLEVDEYEKAYTAIGEIVKAKKGIIANASTTRLANKKIRATITLRIPPDQFEAALAELGKLGTVRHQAITTADVTKQYQDLESRLKSKETLVERLKKVLLEGKGTVKELMEVEVQMGATIEQIESIKGELKYYDNLVGLSTITMQVFEKDLGQPFEYVLTLQSTIIVRSHDADAAYAAAKKAIADAGGQVVDSRMTRNNEESATGYVRGKVDLDKFPGVRGTLNKLGHVDQDTVNQQQTGRGGQGDPNPMANIRKEQAVIDFTVNTPPAFVTRQATLEVEAASAKSAYETARQEVLAAKGKILGGSLNDKTAGVTGFVRAHVDQEAFPALLEKLKSLGVVKSANVNQNEPDTDAREAYQRKGEITIRISSPPPLLAEESGIGRVLRQTFASSIAGILWSFEKLIVGIALAGPWIVLALVVIVVWRRARRKKPTAAP